VKSKVKKRAAQRIEIEVPVHLEQGSGLTRDVSLSGIYFVTDQNFEEGARIRFTIEFEYAIPGQPMHLDCKAHVVRIEPQGDCLGVAARIEDFSCLQHSGGSDMNILPGTSNLQ